MTGDFDERNAAKSRAVCERLHAEAASRGLTGRERRILDMWPKYEDAEYVWFGDAYIDTDGDANEVKGIQFDEGCADLVGIEGFHTGFRIGERVKRPARSVLDADGVEIKVGDTVWTLDGLEGVVTKVEDGAAYIAYESDYAQCEEAANLTHTRPDSWERLEEDARRLDIDLGDTADDYPRMSCVRDIVRRARALAGVEVPE